MLGRRVGILLLGVLAVACGESKPPPSPAKDPEVGVCPEVVDKAPKTPSLASRLGPTIANATEGCLKAGRAHDTETDTAVSGTWSGSYDYADGGRSVRLEVTLNVRDGRLRGTMTEPNTFGTSGYSELEADLVGEAVASNLVTFMKTYRTGDADHSVFYIGELSEDGKTIAGTWTLQENQGPFELRKTGP